MFKSPVFLSEHVARKKVMALKVCSASFLLFFVCLFVCLFWDRVSLFYPGCSAVAQSQLTTASNSQAQALSHLSLLSSWYSSHAPPHLGKEMRWHHVAQTVFKLLGSSHPALTSQSAGITGVDHHAQPNMSYQFLFSVFTKYFQG